MKYILIAVISLGILSCKQRSVKGSNGVVFKDATAYNDYIVNRQTALMKNILAFGKVADINIDSAMLLLGKSSGEAQVMINELRAMPPYDGDSSLRDAAIASFRFYKKAFEKDYMDILRIRKKGEANFTPADVAEANRIVEDLSKEEEGLDRNFQNAQKEFARKNKMTLIHNTDQQQIQGELNEINKE